MSDCYDFMSRRELAFAVFASIGIIMRVAYAAEGEQIGYHNGSRLGNSTFAPVAVAGRAPDVYRVVMAILNFLQVAAITRLLTAMESVGVLFASMSHMIYHLQRVIIPYVMLVIGFSVCFQLFDSPDGFLSTTYRFIGIDDDELDKANPELTVMSWLYALAIDLLLVNLMIAIMTETYFNVSHTLAPSAYRKSRVGLLAEFLVRPLLPQPLDLLEVPLAACVALYRLYLRRQAQEASMAADQAVLPTRTAPLVSQRDSQRSGSQRSGSGSPGSPALARISATRPLMLQRSSIGGAVVGRLVAAATSASLAMMESEEEDAAAEQRVFRALREYACKPPPFRSGVFRGLPSP